MTTITIWSESGGVGKTTTVVNLGAALGKRGLDVLICDLDPQPASVTDYAGFTELKNSTEEPTIEEVLLDDNRNLNEIIVEAEHYNLIPAHEDLANLENKIRAEQIPAAEFILRQNLDPVSDQYDIVLIDAPATLNLLVDNALIASGNVLMPMEMTRKGRKSIEGVLNTVGALESQLQRAQPEFTLDVLGVLPNKISGSKLNQETRTELEEKNIPLLPVSIPDYNILEETWDAQLDIFSYANSPDYGLRTYQESLLTAYEDLAEYITEAVLKPQEQKRATQEVTV